MTRATGIRWTVAAALVAAAAVGRTAWSGLAANDGGAPDPILEERVLASTIAEFERRYTDDPRNPIIGGELVDSHLLMFRLDNDLEHLERAEAVAVELAPLALDAAPAYARVSAARLARHDFAGALASAETAIAANPRDAGALGTLFDAAQAAGRHDRAEWAVRELEVRHHGSLAQAVRTARWLDATGDSGSAYETLGRLCTRLEGRAVARQIVAWCHALLADIEVGLRGPETAAMRYRHVLEIQPGYMAGVEGLADLAYARGDWAVAGELYEKILSDTHPDLYLRLAEVAWATGDAEAASLHEAKFLDLATAPGAAALNAQPLAVFYAADPATHDLALAVAERDLERRRSAEAYETLAWVRLQRGEAAAALEASNAARTRGGVGAASDYIHGRILEATGRREEGGRLIAAALETPAELDHHVLVEVRGG